MKSLAIFGATGSVGDSVIDIVKQFPEKFDVKVLTASKNWEKLAQLAHDLKPEHVVIADETFYPMLRDALAGVPVNILTGDDGLVTAAQMPVDLHVAAIVGIAGLRPTYEAVKCGYNIALANKESLVCAGSFIKEAARVSGAEILPMDSEHNAIFQVLEPENRSRLSRIILTASGGPFRERSRAELADVTVKQALAHPNWEMGAKISIDSATMANKALEVAEAYHLFDLQPDQIDVVIHPQSVVHSMVEYQDGSILAQMGASDMRVPVGYCLFWPERGVFRSDKLDLQSRLDLHFSSIDFERFSMVKVVFDILNDNKDKMIVFNASNEVCVEAFLQQKIGFLDIEYIVQSCVEKINVLDISSLEDVFALDLETRQFAYDIIKNKNAHQTAA